MNRLLLLDQAPKLIGYNPLKHNKHHPSIPISAHHDVRQSLHILIMLPLHQYALRVSSFLCLFPFPLLDSTSSSLTPPHSTTTARTAGQESDDDVEHSDNGGDDCLEDSADAVDDGHETATDGFEDAADLGRQAY